MRKHVFGALPGNRTQDLGERLRIGAEQVFAAARRQMAAKILSDRLQFVAEPLRTP